MKIRIQDSSVRFRITLKELESLVGEGRVQRECVVPAAGGVARLSYAVVVDAALEASDLALEPFAVVLRLAQRDLATLASPAEEGIYIRREWRDSSGVQQRFMVFLEKDRPASTCKKIESWIYEGHQAGRDVLVPQAGRQP